ncbi:Os03g0747150 [Oryza sativa Japonica Group]|uniref:Os03g0747150 protein n=1 Tax=Oryza sativa subsp. japonica TaxID=39947 RepID=A0A0P0W3M0_ORYSJ|nr:Os03g0747150 [Oryza sativa Japonica Group]
MNETVPSAQTSISTSITFSNLNTFEKRAGKGENKYGAELNERNNGVRCNEPMTQHDDAEDSSDSIEIPDDQES